MSTTTRRTVRDLSDLGNIVNDKEKTMPTTTAEKKAAAAASIDTNLSPQIETFMSLVCPFDQVKEPEKFWLWTLTLAADTEEADEGLSMTAFMTAAQADPETFLLKMMERQGSRNMRHMRTIKALAADLTAAQAKNEHTDAELARLHRELKEYMENTSALRSHNEEVKNAAANVIESQKEAAKALETVVHQPVHQRPMFFDFPGLSVKREAVTESFSHTLMKAAAVGVVTAGATYATIRLIQYFLDDGDVV